VNSWFESYLAHQKEVVEINCNGNESTIQGKHVSALREIKQGSILGMILFLLYINDLPVNIKETNMVLFADDMNILVTAEN
jgi:hypothetical protein